MAKGKRLPLSEKLNIINRIHKDMDQYGWTVGMACKEYGISPASYGRWKKLANQHTVPRLIINEDVKEVPIAPPVVPTGLVEEAIQKEVNAFVNELDQRIHAAMEKAVADLYQKYKPS